MRHRVKAAEERPIVARLYSVAEIAAYLGRTERAIEHMVTRRQIPVVRLGHKVQFDLGEIKKWIKRNSETTVRKTANAGNQSQSEAEMS